MIRVGSTLKVCPVCHGDGHFVGRDRPEARIPCTACRGTGRIAQIVTEHEERP